MANSGMKGLFPERMVDGVLNESYIKSFASQLQGIGVEEGDRILVHSSYKSLGGVPGGCEAVIQGLLTAIGEQGTLLLPALSYATSNPEHPIFDQENTPSNVGVIAEYFRKRPGTRRSLCPTHSVCGVGADVDFLLGGHALDTTPVGPHSPFQRLRERGGKVVFLGCGIRCNTSMHGVEELQRPPYLFRGEYSYKMRCSDGTVTRQSCQAHNFRGYTQRYERLQELLCGEELRRGKVFSSEVWVMDAQALWREGHRKLQENPFYFVDPAEEID